MCWTIPDPRSHWWWYRSGPSRENPWSPAAIWQHWHPHGCVLWQHPNQHRPPPWCCRWARKEAGQKASQDWMSVALERVATAPSDPCPGRRHTIRQQMDRPHLFQGLGGSAPTWTCCLRESVITSPTPWWRCSQQTQQRSACPSGNSPGSVIRRLGDT